MVALTMAQRIQNAISRYPKETNAEIAARVRGSRIGQIVGVRAGGGPLPGNTHGKSLDVFRQQYDIRLRIKEGIKKHLCDVYMTEQEFRDACGVSSTEWRKYADDLEFDVYHIRIRGHVMWAQPKMIERMKEIAGIVT